MTVAKRGLIAPQNTFLENVIRRCNNTDTCFILANAQIVDYPIVYCNDGFSKLVGYSRAEIMQKPCSLSFMYGDHSEQACVQRVREALDNARTDQAEIGLTKKNKTQIWLLVYIAPIKNDKDNVVLYLCQCKDITPLKQPLDDENNKGFSRILQIARIAKSKQAFNQIETKDLHKSSTPSASNFTQVMNLGGDMLPQYRQETPKTSPHIILHYSTFKTIWDWSILLLTLYTAFVVPFNIAFKNRFGARNESWLETSEFPIFSGATTSGIDTLALVDSIVDVIFFADILLNFHTTFVGPGGEVVIEPSVIRQNYFKSWFLIDLLSCLPYDIFYMFKKDDERIGSLFSALKVVRLLRLGRVARKMDNYLEYGAATLLLLLCAYVLVAHWLACIWFSIGEYEVRVKFENPTFPDGWLLKLSRDLNAPFGNGSTKTRILGGPTKWNCYVASLYFTMSCMSTVGFGNIASTTDSEKAFAVCMMIISALLYAAIFGHMTTIIQQMTSATVRYHDMIANVREFIKLQEVPKELAERVMDYVVSTWAMTKGIDTQKVLSYCPKDMKADICVHLNRKVFNEHSCFRLASDGCLRQLAMHLESNHAAPGDLLYHTGENVDALWFVVSGSLEVIQDEEVVAILGRGDVFGDEFWKLSGKTGQSAANVRALTYTDLHMIKQEKLMEVLDFYKAFANSFARNLVLTYNLTHRMKFRKVVDVKREKELDARRKNEKLTLDPEHPVRKLLYRMRERHGPRIQPTTIFNDIEKGYTRRADVNRVSSVHSMVDETNMLKSDYDPKKSPRSRRRHTLQKRQTVDEDALSRSANWSEASGPSPGLKNREWSSMAQLRSDVNNRLNELNEKMVTVDLILQRMSNLERILLSPQGRDLAGTPSTLPASSFQGGLNGSYLASPANLVQRSVSWSEQQPGWAPPGPSQPVPPLGELRSSNWDTEDSSYNPDQVPTIHIDTDTERSPSQPPQRPRI
ncbi:unnamed protein product, partial [Mesorhabditis spiculigera]